MALSSRSLGSRQLSLCRDRLVNLPSPALAHNFPNPPSQEHSLELEPTLLEPFILHRPKLPHLSIGYAKGELTNAGRGKCLAACPCTFPR